MAGPVFFVGTYRVPVDRLLEWEARAREMAAFAEASEPRLLGLHHYADRDGGQAVTIQIHPDAASLASHLDVAAARIAGGTRLVEVQRIDLHGDVPSSVLERLRAATPAPVGVKAWVAGFDRVR